MIFRNDFTHNGNHVEDKAVLQAMETDLQNQPLLICFLKSRHRESMMHLTNKLILQGIYDDKELNDQKLIRTKSTDMSWSASIK